MKSKKKKVLLILLPFILLIVAALIFVFKIDFSNDNAISLEENKWIEENKYDVIDIALLNDIPILSYEGEGLLYEYFDYVTNNHSLKFNFIPYKLDATIEYDYKMSIVDKVNKNSIELLKDNMVLLTIDDVFYSNINDINNLKIGVLNTEKEKISNYLNNSTITYVEYDNYNDLKNSIITSKTTKEEGNLEYDVDAIIILKTISVKEIIENNLNVAYHFNDLRQFYVLEINDNNKLNSILNKSFNTWKKDNYEDKYNQFLLNNYYKFKALSDVEQKTLKSKNYVYGFINYGIYNYLDGNKISGINSVVLKQFNKFSGLSITYTQYNSISKLINDFNDNKIDFMFNIVNEEKLNNKFSNSKNILGKELLVVSNTNSNLIVDNLKSLKEHKVLTIKDSYIEKYLTDNGLKFKSYNNLNELVKDFKSNDVMIIDMENYNFYKSNQLVNSRVNLILDTNDHYNYVINNKESNKLFEALFNFYLSFNSINKHVTANYAVISNQGINPLYILMLIVLLLLLYVILDFSNHIKYMIKTLKQSRKINLSKEDKIKYIDQLTSLKNRAYFNSKIEVWDESEVYPQSIIIIDLNNISYINDNYGREEGDKVITEAANILIQSQLANSEIIRTDGNEFLIYLVGYNEKQIVSYLRKLSKDFKNLSHGFGAASGYSIINDAIKTIDDAVNEATLSMKENKEDVEVNEK